MAAIKNIEGLTNAQINHELQQGAKFVIYSYCISLILVTFKRSSDIYFIKKGDSALAPGIGLTILTFFLGWWGLPWGPIYTISAISSNLSGGKDITREVLAQVNGHTEYEQQDAA